MWPTLEKLKGTCILLFQLFLDVLVDFINMISHRLLELQPYKLGKLIKVGMKMTRLTFEVQSNLGYPNADYPKLLGYSKTMVSPDFFLYYLLQ